MEGVAFGMLDGYATGPSIACVVASVSVVASSPLSSGAARSARQGFTDRRT
jgi:hypothetical protein